MINSSRSPSCKCSRYRARLQFSSPSATPAQALLVAVGAEGPALRAAVRPLYFGRLQADRAATSTPVHQREHSLRGRVSRSAEPQNPAKYATTELAAVTPGRALASSASPSTISAARIPMELCSDETALNQSALVCWSTPHRAELLFRSSLLCMFRSWPVTPIICPR